MTSIGFTGTQAGMTKAQMFTVRSLVVQAGFWGDDVHEAHHGDCIGADADFHRIIRRIKGSKWKVALHPPDNDAKRAFCDHDEKWPEKPYIARNHDIVDQANAMIVAPQGMQEIVRSGTWATYRYAKNAKVPTIYVVFYDGSVREEVV